MRGRRTGGWRGRLTLGLMLFVSGCSLRDGSSGTTGLTGPQGPQGTAGAQGPAGPRGDGPLVYRDAKGAYVGIADRWIGNRTDYRDGAGVRWTVAVETGAPSVTSAEQLLFDAAGCTGNAYVLSIVEAGVAFEVEDPIAGPTLRALPVTLAARSVNVADSCNGPLQNRQVVPLDDPTLPAARLTAPSPGFVGPLHLERE